LGKPTGLGKVAQATMNFIQKVAMARKYGKNATTKNNVLKLVEALLALADGEIAVPEDKLKATFNVEWVKEDELLVSGKFQQKRNKQTKIVEGITKEDLWALVECFGKALELSQPKDEKNVDNAQRRGEAIQDVLDCLKDLGILDLKPSARNQGFWKFSLKLNHQTSDKKDNLKIIEEKWKVKIGSVTVEISHETPKPEEEPINWPEICRHNLAQQKQLTTNLFTNANGMTPQLDGVYVPLAIVEPQKPKPQPGTQQEEKEKETEKLIPITEERFFEDVLRQGKSDISQGRKIAIIGEPGAGKTTRLQKIADWISEQDLGLPVWIDLAELGEQDICQFLENVWLRRCQGEVTRRDLEAQMSRVWLLLDGVDEMTHTQGMQQLAKDLLRSWVQAARVVVTCRVNVWEADKNAFSGFDVFRNLEFNPEQVTDYIRRWFAGMGDAATGESLEATLAESENSRLKQLIQNPLRLWMLCQIWQPEGRLPETQAGLYAQFVDWVYRWKADEEILDQREAIDTALARLALVAMDEKDEVSRLRLRESWVVKVLGSRPIFQAVMKLGWLNRVERFPEAICVFYHATFQEYFAALAVDDWDYFLPRNHVNFPVAGKEYRIFEAQWKQVILLWLGRDDIAYEEKERFIQKLTDFRDGCRGAFYTDRSYFMAALAIREFKNYLQSNKIVNQIVKWGFGYFDKNRQTWQTFLYSLEQDAIKALIQTDRTLATIELLSLMSQPQLPERRKQTIQLTLEQLGYYDKKVNCAASKVIENNLSNDIIVPHWKDLPSNVLELADFINAHMDDPIVRIAILKLESISSNNFQTILILLKITKNSTNRGNRWVAVSILIDIVEGNESASLILANLLMLLEKNQQLNLEYMNSENTRYCLTQEAATEMMRILLNTEDEQIRVLSAMSLSNIGKGNNEVIAELIENTKNLTNDKQGEFIIIILGYIGQGNSQVIQALSEIIEFTLDKYIRWRSAESLGKINPGNIQSTTTLLEFLSITEDEVIQSNTPMILEKLSITDRQRATIVNGLSPDSHNFKINQNCLHLWLKNYTFLWNIAHELPYPDFYRAWHGFTETQTSPLVSTQNLPQLLQTKLTATNLDRTFQILCIDTSKFIDPNNPAPDIYEQFLDQNCPERPNGEPETLSQLKSYWNQLRRHSHKPPILIFYEDPTSPAARGFSPTFLDALTRFEGTICLITDTPHPPLQTFSPHDPDLLQTVVNWLKRLHLES
jgi:energy-coupling factor transporter ATP-binding protein EcfA2